jgi:hypothetical protein
MANTSSGSRPGIPLQRPCKGIYWRHFKNNNNTRFAGWLPHTSSVIDASSTMAEEHLPRYNKGVIIIVINISLQRNVEQ